MFMFTFKLLLALVLPLLATGGAAVARDKLEGAGCERLRCCCWLGGGLGRGCGWCGVWALRLLVRGLPVEFEFVELTDEDEPAASAPRA